MSWIATIVCVAPATFLLSSQQHSDPVAQLALWLVVVLLVMMVIVTTMVAPLALR